MPGSKSAKSASYLVPGPTSEPAAKAKVPKDAAVVPGPAAVVD